MKTALALGLLLGMAAAVPQDAPIMVQPADVKWVDGPPALPAGAKVAMMCGDSTKEGPFVMRAKLPADYKVPPHFHPGNENVTVISGTLHGAMGDAFDASKLKTLGAGSFVMFPGKTAHFVCTKEETILQINAMGPWTLTYVNPADDPRNAKK